MKRQLCALVLLIGITMSVTACAGGYHHAPYGYRSYQPAYGNYGYQRAQPYYGSQGYREYNGGRGWGGNHWGERHERHERREGNHWGGHH